MERLYSKRSIMAEHDICEVNYYSYDTDGLFGIKIISNMNDKRNVFEAGKICGSQNEAIDILRKMDQYAVTPLSAEESLEEILSAV